MIKRLGLCVVALAMCGCVGHRSIKALCGIPEDVEEYACWGWDGVDDNMEGVEMDSNEAAP